MSARPVWYPWLLASALVLSRRMFPRARRGVVVFRPIRRGGPALQTAGRSGRNEGQGDLARAATVRDIQRDLVADAVPGESVAQILGVRDRRAVHRHDSVARDDAAVR